MPVSRQQHGRAALNRVLHNIQKELDAIEEGVFAGLVKGANLVIEDCKDGTPPLVPVNLGHLYNSSFVDPIPEENRVKLGFHADYAFYVHEMIGANFKRPGSGAKFLQASLYRNAKEILKLAAEGAKKPK